MNSEPAVASANDWADDVARLVEKPTGVWGSERPLAQRIRELLLHDQAPVPETVRNQVIQQALVVADAANTVGDIEATALREYLRGLFWLPLGTDAFDGSVQQPPPADAEFLGHGGPWNRARVGQRRAWGMLRYWRAKGEADRHDSRRDAENSAGPLRGAATERLIADLDAFFANEEALDLFAVDLDRALVHERHQSSRRTTLLLERRLRRVAASLGRLSTLYPPHLTVEDLVTDRLVSLLGRTQIDRGGDVASHVAAEIVPDDRKFPAMTTLAATRRAVLLGDPGSGKSTLARALVIDATTSGGIAAYVRAAALTTALHTPHGTWLDTIARAALTLRLEPPRDEDVVELSRLLGTEDTAHLVIDGLDEVLDPAERSVIAELIENLALLPGRVLLTSRLTGHRHMPGWSEFQTLPLTDKSYMSVLQRWYGEDGYLPVLRSLNGMFGRDELIHFVKHPVLAGIITHLAGQPGTDFTASRPGLYGQAVAHLCQRRWKTPEQDERSHAEVVALLSAYRRAAWEMAATTTVTTYARLAAAGIDAELLRTGELLQSSALDADADVDQPWGWVHSSFADYLVSQHLLQLLDTDPAEAASGLRRAIQYEAGWIEALRFLMEAATPRQRVRIVAEWRALIDEGDPGGMITQTAHRLFDEYGIDTHRTRGNDVDVLLKRLVTDAEAEAAEAARTEPSARDRLEEMLAGDHERAYLRRPVLTAEVDPGALVIDEYWSAFRSHPFPDNLPFAFAMGDALFPARDSEPSNDERLALWLVTRRRHGITPVQARLYESSAGLTRRAIAGEFGDWGTLCAILHAPDAADPLDPRPHARIGMLLSGLPARRPSANDLDDFYVALANYAPEHLEDPHGAERLLRAIREVQRRLTPPRAAWEDDPDTARLLEAMVLFARSFGEPSPWNRFERVATNPRDLARLVHGDISRRLNALSIRPIFRAALRLYRTGVVVPAAIDLFSHDYLIDPLEEKDWGRAMEVLDWIIDTDSPTNVFGRAIRWPDDERFAVLMLERLGSRLTRGSWAYWRIVSTLADAGQLAHWRDYLLTLSPLAVSE